MKKIFVKSFQKQTFEEQMLSEFSKFANGVSQD